MDQQSTSAPSGAAIKVTPATAGSFVLLVAFFLPWIKFMGQNVAGFELYKLWDPGQFVWVVPIVATVAIVLGLLGRKNVALGQFAGGLLLLFLGIALYQYGKDVLTSLSIGGYLTILCSLFLLFVPRLPKG